MGIEASDQGSDSLYGEGNGKRCQKKKKTSTKRTGALTNLGGGGSP